MAVHSIAASSGVARAGRAALGAGDPRTERPLPAPGARGGHIPALDGVRGIAILLVLVFHFSRYGHGLVPSRLFIDRLYYHLSGAGWIGVDLFFVLSGFLITGILYDAKGGGHYFRNFYLRRVLRIFPLYYGALILFLIVLPAVFPSEGGFQWIRHDAAWYWTYLSNIEIARNGWPAFGALGHFWSLAVEEQFYFVWPLIVLALSRRQLQTACVACLVAALSLRVGLNVAGNTTAAFVLTPARLGALAVGGFIALTARGPAGLTRLARPAPRVAALLSLTLLALFVIRRGLNSYDPVVSTIGHTLLACFFGSVLVVALTAPRHGLVGRIFGSSGLGFFGRYSYGLYVFHHPILFLAPGILPLTLIPSVFGSQLLRQFVYLVIATGVSVAIALVSWHVLEKPFLRLKRRFPYESSKAKRSRDANEQLPVGLEP